MASHKLNPNEGEVWESPRTPLAFKIHSLTDDGWVRYYQHWYGTTEEKENPYPLFTQPTMDFISKYRKADYDNE